MTQRSVGIDLSGLVQVPARAKTAIAPSRRCSGETTTMPWRVIVGDDTLESPETAETDTQSADRTAGSAVRPPSAMSPETFSPEAIPERSSRFRDIDRKLGRVVAAWPSLSQEVQAAVMTLVERAGG